MNEFAENRNKLETFKFPLLALVVHMSARKCDGMNSEKYY